jgi:acetyltransferase-like isoleucine patch superfamily enzyme
LELGHGKERMTQDPAGSVHDTAIVEAGAELGPGTQVWHHAHVRRGAHVGAGCILGKNVYVDATVRIGDRVKIENNVSIYKGVDIGDDVFVGPHVVFTNDRLPRATNRDWTVVPTVVRRGASLGAHATVVCGVDIGEWAMVGAGAVVTRSVPDHRLVVGVPARPAGWVCRCGTVVSRAADRPPSLECDACAGQDPAAPTGGR